MPATISPKLHIKVISVDARLRGNFARGRFFNHNFRTKLNPPILIEKDVFLVVF
jgi:hypothetical protein